MDRRWGWVALVVWLAGCNLPDDLSRSPAVRPYEEPRRPADGTRAIGDPPILGRQTAWAVLENPRPSSATVLEEGAELYRIYCEVCHGADGAGEGSVSKHFRRVPDLGAPYVARYQDGRLHTIIRQGGFEMPGYADALSEDERWAVVHYVRTFGDGR